MLARPGPSDKLSARARRPGRRFAPACPAGGIPGLREHGGRAAAAERLVSLGCLFPARGLESVTRSRSLVRRVRVLGRPSRLVVAWRLPSQSSCTGSGWSTL
jgi:hypothetical protein